LRRIAEGREEVKRRQNELKAKMGVLRQVAPLDVDFSALRSPSLCVVAGVVEAAKAGKMMKLLEGTKASFEEKRAESSKGRIAVVVVADKAHEAAVREALLKAGLMELSLEGIEGNPREALELAAKEMNECAVKLARFEEELSRLSKDNWARVAALREALEIEEERCTATQKFGRSAKMFAFEGWIVQARFEGVKAELERIAGNRVLVQKAAMPQVDEHGHGAHGAVREKAPTLLQNPKPLEPFENLVKFISLPASDEIDPTMIFAITFPMMYGMIVGDVGYGIMSFFIAWLMLKKLGSKGLLGTVAKTWMLAAIPAIIFGVIFDEYFGFSHAHLLGLPEGQAMYTGLHRLSDTTLLMVLVIFVGAAQVMLGFALGAWNAMKHGHKKHALAKLGWIGVELGGIVLVMSMLFNMFPADVGLAAGVLLGLSLIPIVMAEGPLGLMEITSLSGNILSYARIMAVGIAGVVVAEEILNKMLVPDPNQGLIFFIVLPLFILFHMMNLLLAMFESLVQGARLNLVEFFSKFYSGGGV
ncbi:MAG: V-type ATPase 116kDa subunit family protein, partial [Candidatus Micrarchaeia archaeon]